MSNKDNNYRGIIPFDLYITLENSFPRLNWLESDVHWLNRLMRDPNFPQQLRRRVRQAMIHVELRQEVHRRWLAVAGAQRIGDATPGPRLVPIRNNHRVKTTIADRYQAEMMNGDGTHKLADEIYDLMLSEFDASTPVDGSIFWNGINELALARLVEQWNRQYRYEVFGQLEATTAARYVNKKFEWVPGAFTRFFTDASARLGLAARGHVTSVVRCGMRNDSIFTTTELPRMLKQMERQIQRGEAPSVTNITIVVIEPKNFSERPVKAFTNHELTMVPIITKNTGRQFIGGRDDCHVSGRLDISPIVQNQWKRQPGNTQPSAAARKIMSDFTTLIRWP